MYRLIALSTLLLVVTSCGGDLPVLDGGADAGADAGLEMDGGPGDDASIPDASTPDAGTDAGTDLCANGMLDAPESDIDCGGTCGGCDNGQMCTAGTDCVSSSCFEDACRPYPWTRAADLPIPRSHYATATDSDGMVYIFGGRIGGAPQDHVHMYNPALDAWAALAPMPTARAGVSAIQALNGRFYVIGGETERDAFGFIAGTSRVVESFDPIGGTWRSEPDLPEGHGFGGVALYSGRVLVFGGIGAGALEDGAPGAPHPNTLRLNEMSGMWTDIGALLSTDQRDFAVATLPGIGVLAIGGWRTAFRDAGIIDAVDLYDTRWFTREPLPEAVEGPSAARVRDVVYVFGGLTNVGATRIITAVRSYRAGPNRWTVLEDAPMASTFGGAARLDPDRILVIGGLAGSTPRSPTGETWIYRP